jgi:hypothetical protein
MIAIDFAPGAHGHFLEYVVNRWIYQVPYTMEDPFQSSGSSHRITQDLVYQQSKIAKTSHYTVHKLPYPDNTEKVIVIKHCSRLDYVLLTNVFYRTHPDAVRTEDFPTEKIQQLHIGNISANGKEPTEIELRDNWYNKLYERDIFGTHGFQKTKLPYFEFDYQTFFNFPEFVTELQRLSDFLNFTFVYNTDLWQIWKTFIDSNQGWLAYQHADELLTKIYSNQSSAIEPDWKLHAWINTCLSRTFRIYSGSLFDGVYPTNTQQVSNIITEHIKEFDLHF